MLSKFLLEINSGNVRFASVVFTAQTTRRRNWFGTLFNAKRVDPRALAWSESKCQTFNCSPKSSFQSGKNSLFKIREPERRCLYFIERAPDCLKLTLTLLYVRDTSGARKLESYRVTKQSASRQLTCVILPSRECRIAFQMHSRAEVFFFSFRHYPKAILRKLRGRPYARNIPIHNIKGWAPM